MELLMFGEVKVFSLKAIREERLLLQLGDAGVRGE